MNFLTLLNPSYRSKKWWRKRYEEEFEYSNHLLGKLDQVLGLLAEERREKKESA